MASLMLGDLNDYIEPSQACIIPVNKTEVKDKSKENEPVTINLTDCLACSGCITSAETILVTEQSHSKLLEAIDSCSFKEISVSVAPQCVAALASRFKLDYTTTWRKLCTFLRGTLGVRMIVDIAEARSITLECLAEEFFRLRQAGGDENLPLIVSACPGWVCYAEKRYPDFLPHLSRTRSPQQIAGTLVKHFWPQANTTGNDGLVASDIFHCAIMPCFDKKLEASREEFLADVLTGTREVDTVITTSELLEIFKEKQVEFDRVQEDRTAPEPWRPEGSGSGGYLEYVLAKAIAASNQPGNLLVVPGKNSDTTEYHYVCPATGKVLLRFAAITGFRNIQTYVIKQRKATAIKYDFVEIMACPGGCLNGGGQPKPEDSNANSRQASKEQLADFNRVYASIPTSNSISPLANELISWIKEDPESRQRLLTTTFRAIEENPALKKKINVNW